MKRILTLALSTVMLLSLAACGKEEENVIEASQTAEDVEVISENTEKPMLPAVYYHGDDNAEYIIEEQTELPEQYEPQDVIDLLTEKKVLPEGIIVNDWGCDENKIMNIDFNEVFSDALQGMGTAGEYIMLGSTVNSLISVFELSGVIITVNGEAPATGHEIYDYVLNFYE